MTKKKKQISQYQSAKTIDDILEIDNTLLEKDECIELMKQVGKEIIEDAENINWIIVVSESWDGQIHIVRNHARIDKTLHMLKLVETSALKDYIKETIFEDDNDR